jgi:hypothetical protein
MHVCRYVQLVGSQVVGLRKGDSLPLVLALRWPRARPKSIGRGHVRGQRRDKTGNDTNSMSGIDDGRIALALKVVK